MFKQKLIHASLVSGSVLAALCLFASTATAQKGPQSTEGAPLRGVDVKLGRNPGGTAAARTIHVDDNGKFDAGTLDAGSYTLTLLPPKEANAATSNARSTTDADVYLVTIKLGTREPIVWAWDPAKKKAFKPQDAQARATGSQPVYQDTIVFEVPNPGPYSCEGTLVKSKSNITNNRTTKP